MSIKVLCLMGKSACGKSTFAKDLLKRGSEDKLMIVKSYTTRGVREGDPNDKETHVFLSPEDYLKVDSNDIVALYESPDGYFNWTDISSFDKDKINIYVIDPIAFASMSNDNRFDVIGIYLYVDEDERMRRYYFRENTYDGFNDEPHLDFSIVSHLENVYKIEAGDVLCK